MEVKSVKGYYVVAPLDERSSGRVKGPFSERGLASLECEGAGWYGSNGHVEEVWFLQLENGRLLAEYNPKSEEADLQFVDIKRNYEKEMKEKIRSKLSEEEIEFLNLK